MNAADDPEPAGTAQRERRCGGCAHFVNDPAAIERLFPGLNVMSSGHASVRAHDGICGFHDIYLSFRDTCRDFVSDLDGAQGG